jgi:hypothetical protein
MPFSYYDRLSRHERAIYDQSDRVARVDLPLAPFLRPLVDLLRVALERDRRPEVEAIAQRLCLGITRALGVEDAQLAVLAVRPTLRDAELHGLYTRDGQRPPRIQLWMRTVHYKRVVAFRTFLRTLLHEVCHHLDYTYLKLEDSFHTEGFFKRESSLFYQLVPREAEAAGTATRRGGI